MCSRPCTSRLGLVKNISIKLVSDLATKDHTADQMLHAVKNSKGKMKPSIGIIDPQIVEVVAFYRGLKQRHNGSASSIGHSFGRGGIGGAFAAEIPRRMGPAGSILRQ